MKKHQPALNWLLLVGVVCQIIGFLLTHLFPNFALSLWLNNNSLLLILILLLLLTINLYYSASLHSKIKSDKEEIDNKLEIHDNLIAKWRTKFKDHTEHPPGKHDKK